MKTLWRILVDTVEAFIADDAFRLAAAVAFWAALSLAPTLLLALAIAGPIWGPEASQHELVRGLRRFLGPGGASTIRAVLAGANRPQGRGLAAGFGIAILVFAASGIFAELRSSLDTIWGVRPPPHRRAWRFVRRRILSLLMLLGAWAVVLGSVALSATIRVVMSELDSRVTGAASLWPAVNMAASLILFAILFTLVLTILPDTRVPWSCGLAGGVLTAVLFSVGKEVIGLYLARSGLRTTYGAAGSLVVLLAWVYYSGLILFLGAEFTKILTRRRGGARHPPPAPASTPAAR